MKRYNFDKIPVMAMGVGIHAETLKQAWGKVYRLAKNNGYAGKLLFRDNLKCPKYRSNRGYGCDECH